MAAQSPFLLTSGFVTNAAASFNVTFPENVLVIVDVVNFHSTPASLSTISLSHAGISFATLGTRTVGTSPTRRITRFACMADAGVDVGGVTTIVVDNGITQGNIGWTVVGVGGVNPAGINGSAAYGATVGYDSGNSNVTTVPGSGLALGAAQNLQCGFLASWVSAVGGTGMTPRTGWSELDEFQLNVSAVRTETQFIATPDTHANVVAGSGLLMGLATEIRSIPNPVSVSPGSNVTLSNAAMPTVITLNAQRGVTYFFMTGCGDFSSRQMVLTIAGLTPSLIYDGVNSGNMNYRIYAFRPDADVTLTLTLTVSPFTATLNAQYRIVAVSNLDTAIGTAPLYGLVQSANHPETTALVTHDISDLVSAPDDAHTLLMLLFESTNGGSAPTFARGWQGHYGAQAGIFTPTCSYRVNSENSPSYNAISSTSGADVAGMIFELQQAPVPVASNPPTVTLVSPSEASPLPATTPAVIDVTDTDGDLVNYLIIVTMPTLGVSEVAWNGTAWTTQYTTSSRATVTGGWRNTIRRNSGWPDSTVQISIIAFDSEGNVTDESFAWFVEFSAPASESTDLGITAADDHPKRDILVDEVAKAWQLTTTGDLALVGGVPSIAQAQRQAIRAFLGEWFLDESVGVPWWQKILGGKQGPAVAAAILRETIAAVPGTGEITELTATLDNATRELTVAWRCASDLGELVETVTVPLTGTVVS